MKKRMLSLLMALCMIVGLLPTMALAAGDSEGDKGSITTLTTGGNVEGDTVTFSTAELTWYRQNNSVGRWQDGWWVGIDIIAPASVTDDNIGDVMFSGNDNTEKSFDNSDDGKNADGKYHMTCWLPILPEYVENALAKNKTMTWTYKFDWDGNSEVDQTFTIEVYPENITLKNEAGTDVEFQTEEGIVVIKGGKGQQGSIEEITQVGTVDGDKITVSGSALTWVEKDTTVGRWQDGWWVGVKIIAPESVNVDNVANVTYSNNGSDTLDKNFGTNKDGQTDDGKYWMGCWSPITPEKLEKALANKTSMTWTYKFDWTGDSKVDQTFTITVDPNDITLNKDGDVYFQTENGIVVVRDGETVHYHDYGTEWEYDSEDHWKECECGAVTDNESHDYTTTDGKTYTCKVCGYTYKDTTNDKFMSDLYYYMMHTYNETYNKKYTITATAGEGGKISNSGKSEVKSSKNVSYTITPDEGFEIESVIVDGKDVGAVDEYTFKNVRANHKITVIFAEVEEEPVIDEPAIDAEAETIWDNPFIDIFDTDSYYEAIEFVYENGLFKGVSDIEFAPDATMTRAMFVTVLGRLSGINPEDYTGSSFDDVEVGTWYAPYVEWVASEGIILGYGDGTFGVDNKLTVEQAAVIMARYAEYTGISTETETTLEDYSDAEDVADWAADQMTWIVEEEIYNAEDGVLNPKAPAERALIAEILYTFVEKFSE